MHCDICLYPFDPEINRVHPQLKGSLYVKFHDVSCKGKAIKTNIFKNQCIVTLTIDAKIKRADPQLMGSLYVKFHDDR